MLDINDSAPTLDYEDPISSDPRTFAAKVNSWVPHDIVLKDAWFPLAHSFAVEAKPVRRAVYSQPYFLWRENGLAVASEFHPAEGLQGAKTAFSDAAGRYPVIEKYGYVWGWFGNPANAEKLKGRLQAIGPTRVHTAVVNGANFYRVRIGPYANVEDADIAMAQVVGLGEVNALIVVDK